MFNNKKLTIQKQLHLESGSGLEKTKKIRRERVCLLSQSLRALALQQPSKAGESFVVKAPRVTLNSICLLST